MKDERYHYLNTTPDSLLSSEEIAEGWHFCYDWDELLIHPDMKDEWECCICDCKKAFK